MPLRPIKPGDTIRMVSPASPLSPEKLEFITRLLETEGYKIEVAPHALDWTDYLAGSDEDRAADLMDAFADESVAAVLCTRGGYGCARLLPYVDFDEIASANKALMGFSDITTLHLALNRRGVPTIHSPMALTLHYPREEFVYESFRRVIRGDLTTPVDAPLAETVVGGKVDGAVVGGCMCLLTDSVGTKEPLETAGKILVIEDVDEMPHRLDAMLTVLLNTGLAEQAAGFVIGEMTRSDDDDKYDHGIGRRPWRDILVERLAPLRKPMVINFPFGHMKGMLTVPLGIRAQLDADAGTLTYLEPLFA